MICLMIQFTFLRDPENERLSFKSAQRILLARYLWPTSLWKSPARWVCIHKCVDPLESEPKWELAGNTCGDFGSLFLWVSTMSTSCITEKEASSPIYIYISIDVEDVLGGL